MSERENHMQDLTQMITKNQNELGMMHINILPKNLIEAIFRKENERADGIEETTDRGREDAEGGGRTSEKPLRAT